MEFLRRLSLVARAKNKNAENNRHINRIIYGEYFDVRRINCTFTAKLAEKKTCIYTTINIGQSLNGIVKNCYHCFHMCETGKENSLEKWVHWVLNFRMKQILKY